MLVMTVCAGCMNAVTAPARFEPVTLPNDQQVPRAVVYGNLMSLLPRYDATPALEMFLYGPGDYGKTALRNPQGMALIGDRLLVCDQGRPDVVAIDLRTGRSLPLTNADHRPRCPVAVAADEERVYVADTRSQCVAVYDPRGRLVEELTPSSGPVPANPAAGFRPASVLLHGGVLYAGNVGGRRVERYDLGARRWLDPLVPPAESPRLIAPTGLAVAADGTLLIADGVQGHVRRVGPDGRWLEPIGRPGRRPGELVRPKQVAATPSGRIVVADAGRQSLVVFDADGKLHLEVFGGNGPWPGFTLPAGVLALPADRAAAWTLSPPADDYLLVSDELGGTPLTLVGLSLAPAGEVANAR
ncbi:MAG: hypothetical protein HRF43_12285 [Phycisphaerae bacterium]